MGVRADLTSMSAFPKSENKPAKFKNYREYAERHNLQAVQFPTAPLIEVVQASLSTRFAQAAHARRHLLPELTWQGFFPAQILFLPLVCHAMEVAVFQVL